jgi:hypothetical protein
MKQLLEPRSVIKSTQSPVISLQHDINAVCFHMYRYMVTSHPSCMFFVLFSEAVIAEV